MKEIEPVAYLVGSGAPQVERRPGGAHVAEAGVGHHHAVGGGGTAGELGVAEQATGKRADPDIEVFVCGPGILAAAGVGLDLVVIDKTADVGAGAGDAIGGVAVGIAGGQRKQ